MELYSSHISTPIGDMLSIVDSNSLYLLEFFDRKDLSKQVSNLQKLSNYEIIESRDNYHDVLQLQLDEYFSSNRKKFDLNLNYEGTVFQMKVWNELLNVKYGETRSYLEQSIKLGDAKSIRAVATANARNRIAIIIPCHRIIGKNGDLTGYAGGIWRKDFLLKLEKQYENELF